LIILAFCINFDTVSALLRGNIFLVLFLCRSLFIFDFYKYKRILPQVAAISAALFLRCKNKCTNTVRIHLPAGRFFCIIAGFFNFDFNLTSI